MLKKLDNVADIVVKPQKGITLKEMQAPIVKIKALCVLSLNSRN